MNTIIGTCSRCGGPVGYPTVWYGTVPPVPTCSHCGATAKNPYGPVIPTERTRTYEGSHAGFADAVRVPEPPKENQV